MAPVKHRGETRHFTYTDVAIALGLSAMTVKKSPRFRAMVRARDLLGLAAEIMHRRGWQPPENLDKDRANGAA